MATQPTRREYKVIVLGSPRVGKTSLIQRYMFNDFSEDVPQCAQEEKKEVTVRDKDRNTKVPLLICDMAGQDRLELQTMNFYKDTSAIIFVYDITNQASLFDCDVWIKDIRIYLNEQLWGIPVLFVGNKEDLRKPVNIIVPSSEDQQDEDDFESSREEEVDEKQVKRITKENKFLDPVLCSAKTGKGVDRVFMTIADTLSGKKPPQTGFCKYL